MKASKPFAQTLLDWRRKRKLNRAEACRLFNVPYRTWQDWEAEIHIPSLLAQSAIKNRMANIRKPYTHEQLMRAGRGRNVCHMNKPGVGPILTIQAQHHKPENFGKEKTFPHGTGRKNLAQD